MGGRGAVTPTLKKRVGVTGRLGPPGVIFGIVFGVLLVPLRPIWAPLEPSWVNIVPASLLDLKSVASFWILSWLHRALRPVMSAMQCNAAA